MRDGSEAMSSAHELFRALRLEFGKGESTAYPASAEGPSEIYRYWATVVGGQIQFGAQMKKSGTPFEPHIFKQLEIFNFKLRNNQREAFIELPGDVKSAIPLAKMAIAVLRAAMENTGA
jgi:hypothetical protein